MFIQRIVGLLLAGVIAVTGVPTTGQTVEPALEAISTVATASASPTQTFSQSRMAAKERASRSKVRETPKKVKALRTAPVASTKKVVPHKHVHKVKKTYKPVSEHGNRALGKRLAASRGWGHGQQWNCLERLWTEESGWRVHADNPNSSAYGIPQALPGSKMGAGWQNNATVQIRWGLKYIKGRYGNPCSALNAKHSKGWY